MKLQVAVFGGGFDDITTPWYRQIERAFVGRGVTPSPLPATHFHLLTAKVLTRLGLLRGLRPSGRRAYVVPIMDAAEYRFFPVCYRAEIVPICFDCWPHRWGRFDSMFRRHNIRIAFVTSKVVRDEFARRHPQIRFEWLPEAVDPAEWDGAKPLARRSIDVLELGRKHQIFHDAVVGPFGRSGYRHLYQPDSVRVIFSCRAELVAGLADTKISVCFPKSVTHPEIAGPVETVTMRYFESMASRCLLVGHCPEELGDLFGYDPIIAVDGNDPAGQLTETLANIDRYQHLVDRNYRTLLEKATWSQRAEAVLQTLAAGGH